MNLTRMTGNDDARMKHHPPYVFERIIGRREVMESDGISDASIDFMDEETSEEED